MAPRDIQKKMRKDPKAFTKIALGEFRGFQDGDEEKPIVKATIFKKNLPIFFTKYNWSASGNSIKLPPSFRKPLTPLVYKEYDYSWTSL